MDLFFKCLAPTTGVKRRVHFNEFMLDVHQRLHRLNTMGGSEEDAAGIVATELVNEGWLICFDEFQVTT